MRLVFDHAGAVECWEIDGEFYVYAGDKLLRVCPSIGMAREIAAGCEAS